MFAVIKMELSGKTLFGTRLSVQTVSCRRLLKTYLFARY